MEALENYRFWLLIRPLKFVVLLVGISAHAGDVDSDVGGRLVKVQRKMTWLSEAVRLYLTVDKVLVDREKPGDVRLELVPPFSFLCDDVQYLERLLYLSILQIERSLLFLSGQFLSSDDSRFFFVFIILEHLVSTDGRHVVLQMCAG